MRRTMVPALVAIAMSVVPSAAHAGHRGWGTASSVGRDALVAAALGVPAVQGDWHGDVQAGGSILAAGGTT